MLGATPVTMQIARQHTGQRSPWMQPPLEAWAVSRGAACKPRHVTGASGEGLQRQAPSTVTFEVCCLLIILTGARVFSAQDTSQACSSCLAKAKNAFQHAPFRRGRASLQQHHEASAPPQGRMAVLESPFRSSCMRWAH